MSWKWGNPCMYLFSLHPNKEKKLLKRQYYVPFRGLFDSETSHISRYQNSIDSYYELEKKELYTLTSFMLSNISEFNIEQQKIQIVV